MTAEKKRSRTNRATGDHQKRRWCKTFRASREIQTGNRTLCEPTQGRNAHQHVTKPIAYGRSKKERRSPGPPPILCSRCVIEVHINMAQKTFYREICSNNAATWNRAWRRLCASLRCRNAHQNEPKIICDGNLEEPKTAAHTLYELARSKCAFTWNKEPFMRTCICKKGAAEWEHPHQRAASTTAIRSAECEHSVCSKTYLKIGPLFPPSPEGTSFDTPKQPDPLDYNPSLLSDFFWPSGLFRPGLLHFQLEMDIEKESTHAFAGNIIWSMREHNYVLQVVWVPRPRHAFFLKP